ncbi:MAG: (2Fe-2S) ferredoxin domain-containing protein [Candidatus Sericytochromatia bacterium]|nr:(2Fe-2S) ferredoxin domain-containing protein [Candidatus Sericytochromatia bacterium]
MPKPQHHIFVCQNERAADNPRGCCKLRGGAEVLAKLKETITGQGLRAQVEFDGSTCVDTCAWGPVMVVYPAGTWYGKVTPEDVTEIVAAVAAGQVVTRLLIPDEAIRRS